MLMRAGGCAGDLRDPEVPMSSIISLQGMHAATASTIGWIRLHGPGPECFFCGEPASLFKPVDRGPRGRSGRLWWCPPCDTTWQTS